MYSKKAAAHIVLPVLKLQDLFGPMAYTMVQVKLKH